MRMRNLPAHMLKTTARGRPTEIETPSHNIRFAEGDYRPSPAG